MFFFLFFSLFLFLSWQIFDMTKPPDEILTPQNSESNSWMTSDGSNSDVNLLSPNELVKCNANGNKNLNSVLLGDTFLGDRMSPTYFVNPLSDTMKSSMFESNRCDENLGLETPMHPSMKDGDIMSMNSSDNSLEFASSPMAPVGLADENGLFDCNLFINTNNDENNDNNLIWSGWGKSWTNRWAKKVEIQLKIFYFIHLFYI